MTVSMEQTISIDDSHMVSATNYVFFQETFSMLISQIN